MLSPGYTYDKAPDQEHFLGEEQDAATVPSDSEQSRRQVALQHEPAVPGISDGQARLQLHAVGHADLQHFRLAEAVLSAAGRLRRHFRGIDSRDRVGEYGTESGNPKCANCMVHSGYEASAMNDTFGSLGGFLATVRATLFNKYKDPGRDGRRAAHVPAPNSRRLVQISTARKLEFSMSEVNPEHEAEEKLGVTHENLEGWVPALASEKEIRAALEKAFDYRGDITITLKDGEKIEGYIFDRKNAPALSDCFVRLLPRTIRAKFLTRRRGAGFTVATRRRKELRAWVKKYSEKKAAGENNIGIDAEPLD